MGNIFLPAAFPVLTATTADGIILTPMPDEDGTAIINAGETLINSTFLL